MTDQQFAGAMSNRIGTKYLTTPHMDSLSKRGVQFVRAYAPNPLCMPARASIFSGRYPHETGVTRNRRPPEGHPIYPCMGTYFQNAGYETAYFGKWHLIYRIPNMQSHGFRVIEKTKQTYDPPYDTSIADSVLEYLDQKPKSPFLLVASFMNPHNICQYPRKEKFSCGEIGNPPEPELCPPVPFNLEEPKNETDTMLSLQKIYQASPAFPVGDFNANDWRRFRWAYYRMIEKVDHEIGRILDKLEKTGLNRNTVIVFTSDHGDCAGAHRWNQKTVFYEESAKVPLIILPPKSVESFESDHLVNIGVDLLPTLLDYAGIDIPEELPGLSLRPVLEKSTPGHQREYLVVQNHMDPTVLIDGTQATISGRLVVGDRYKYSVYSAGSRRESLFDIMEDPGETVNLAYEPDYSKVVSKHRSYLEQHAITHQDGEALKMLADGVPPIPFTLSPRLNKVEK